MLLIRFLPHYWAIRFISLNISTRRRMTSTTRLQIAFNWEQILLYKICAEKSKLHTSSHSSGGDTGAMIGSRKLVLFSPCADDRSALGSRPAKEKNINFAISLTLLHANRLGLDAIRWSLQCFGRRQGEAKLMGRHKTIADRSLGILYGSGTWRLVTDRLPLVGWTQSNTTRWTYEKSFIEFVSPQGTV